MWNTSCVSGCVFSVLEEMTILVEKLTASILRVEERTGLGSEYVNTHTEEMADANHKIGLWMWDTRDNVWTFVSKK